MEDKCTPTGTAFVYKNQINSVNVLHAIVKYKLLFMLVVWLLYWPDWNDIQ